jgi:hypothetical protein
MAKTYLDSLQARCEYEYVVRQHLCYCDEAQNIWKQLYCYARRVISAETVLLATFDICQGRLKV